MTSTTTTKKKNIQAQVYASKTRRECHIDHADLVLVATHTSDCLIIYVWFCDGRGGGRRRGEGLNPSVHHVKIVFQQFAQRIKMVRLKF